MLARLQTDERTARNVADLIVEALAAADVAVSLIDAGGGRWQVELYFRAAPDRDFVRGIVAAAAGGKAAAGLRFARAAATDWVGQSLAGLAPVAAGRFLVHGGHDRARIPPNRIGIEVEAALAFGTGHHGTTRGCLLALDRMCKAIGKPKPAPSPSKGEGRGGGRHARRFMTPTRFANAHRASPFRGRKQKLNILDLGTGSGVLAIAAARALRARVLAADIDRNAVRVARANARLNRAGAMIEVVRADGVTAPSMRAREPFDLILANILLGPLLRLAVPLKRLAAPHGRIVLSGVLPTQANALIAAYRPLALERRIALDGWTTLVFARGRRRRAVARPRPYF